MAYTGAVNRNFTPKFEKLVIFISGDGSDVSRIAREPLFGIGKHTITGSLNFEGFWKFWIFSCFFVMFRKWLAYFFHLKKMEILVLAAEAFPRGPLRL